VQFRAEARDVARVRIIDLAGSLQGEMSAELRRICDASPKPLRPNLADLVSVDALGLGTLLALEQRGAELANASPYVMLQLDAERARRVETCASGELARRPKSTGRISKDGDSHHRP
jgi:hypothetical protein